MEGNSRHSGTATAVRNGRTARRGEVDEHLRKVDEALEELDELVGEDDEKPERAKDEEGAAA